MSDIIFFINGTYNIFFPAVAFYLSNQGDYVLQTADIPSHSREFCTFLNN
ncbi:MAG: hypothetical protein LBT62_05120 [Deltaproteobacteria bacterium]|nr:hypothetical protein [Deltaproteobacteria bacterium]